jgi:hypothetical protein
LDETKDKLNRRCPRLGSPVFFQYCRTCEEEKQPCWKIIDCWWEAFDIISYLRDNYSEETFQALSEAKPKPKVNHLVTLIEQAKQRLGQK